MSLTRQATIYSLVAIRNFLGFQAVSAVNAVIKRGLTILQLILMSSYENKFI